MKKEEKEEEEKQVGGRGRRWKKAIKRKELSIYLVYLREMVIHP